MAMCSWTFHVRFLETAHELFAQHPCDQKFRTWLNRSSLCPAENTLMHGCTLVLMDINPHSNTSNWWYQLIFVVRSQWVSHSVAAAWRAASYQIHTEAGHARCQVQPHSERSSLVPQTCHEGWHLNILEGKPWARRTYRTCAISSSFEPVSLVQDNTNFFPQSKHDSLAIFQSLVVFPGIPRIFVTGFTRPDRWDDLAWNTKH